MIENSSVAGSLECVFDTRHELDELGEGATWDVAAARLISVDIMRGHVHLFDPHTNTARTITWDSRWVRQFRVAATGSCWPFVTALRGWISTPAR